MRAIASLAYAAALLVLLAARTMSPAWAALGLAAGLLLALASWRSRRGLGAAAAVVAIVACASTWAASARIGSMPLRWEQIADRQVQRGVQELRAVAEDATARAHAALADALADAGGPGAFAERGRAALFQLLEGARRGRADALFARGPSGELLAWSGHHQGALPEAALVDSVQLAFAEGPLFDYLYVLADAPGGNRLVAAVLLESDPALADRELPSVASVVRDRTGARPRFGAGPGPPDAPWRLGPEGAAVAHAVLDVATPAQWRAAEMARARGLAAALAALVLALALGLWLAAGPPTGRPTRLAPAAALGLALAIAPQPGGGADSIFGPAMFFLDAGDGVTLWGGLVVALTVAVLSAAHGGIPDRRGAAPLAAAAVAATFAAGIWVVTRSTSDVLYRSPTLLWWALQVSACAALCALAAAVLPRPRAPDGTATRASWRWATGAVGLGAALALGLVFARRPWQGPDPGLAAAWVAPAYLLARATARFRPGGLRRWLATAALAATALLPQLWLGAQAARMRGAQEDVGSLTSASDDTYLTFVLRRFGGEARERLQRGEAGAALLYRAWVGSGLAAEGYPVRLALWNPRGEVAERLDVIGSMADRDVGTDVIEDVVATARESQAALDLAAPTPPVRRARADPLGDGWTASALVLPRRSLAPEGLAAAALAARPPPPSGPVLTLTQSTAPGPSGAGLTWAASPGGVRGEGEIRLADRLYHAHVEIDQDPPVVRAARGALLLLVDLLALALVWALARALAGSGWPQLAPWIPAPGSFRSRVTLALFLFFLAPTLAFGAVAYRALAGTAEREAEALVSRASAQASNVFPAAGGDLQAIAGLVGLPVLFYQQGELLTSSRPELVELGVHDAWLPPEAHLALRLDEALALDRGRLLGRRVVAAYRRLPEAVLGVPAFPGGAAVTRRAELTDMLVFAVVVGGFLSLALSLAAGRALARPIGELSRAASAVGAGRLRMRLPSDRRDEFGELFRSFNRMARRLRRARARELRSARVLAWGEMARQVAHEIKNPLTPIRLSVQHVRRAYRDGRDDFGEILEGNVERVLHEIDRLSGIARAFARYGAPPDRRSELEAVDVAAVARDVQALYASGERSLAVRIHSADGAPPAAARDTELREVLINLFENARDALPEDGVVEVTVGPRGGGVVLEVSDAGEGIPADVLPSVFEPHFSTRSSGTGLGLAIVRRLVEDWGGRVEVESEPGRGTTVRLWLPAYGPDPDGDA